MNNKKNLVFLGVVALIGAGILYVYFSRPVKDSGLSADIADINVVQSPTPTSTPQPALSPTKEEPFSGLHGIKSPATCQVGGEIDFSSKDLFSSNGSKISWQNVDSQGRLINWHISPKDNLAIGPNIFGNLDVPNGEYENLTVRLPESPVAKSYLLTASVTYGQFIQGDLKVKEVNCTGQVRVNLTFEF